MNKKEFKTGLQILDEYFKKLSDDSTLDEKLRNCIVELWREGRLMTKTHLARKLEELRKEDMK